MKDKTALRHCFSVVTFALVSILILFNFANLTQAERAVVTAVRIGGTVEKTRLVIELVDGEIYSALISPDGLELRVSIPEVKFELSTGQKVRGLITRHRYGVAANSQSQLIVDFLKPVRIIGEELIKGEGKKPNRLVFDFEPTVIKSAAADVVAEPANERPVVVIDPGHGGVDPGAVSSRNIKEKDVVFAFATVLQRKLLATGQFDVAMTRNSDSFVSLRDRISIAREKRAELFIAIHADIFRGQTARGTTIYTLSDKASDKEAEELANKENRSDIIAGTDLGEQAGEVADILIELAMRESKDRAVHFAQNAVKEIEKVTLVTSKPLRSAGFVVLKAPDVPSVLVELGFLSSKADEQLLIDPAWQDRVAKAFVTAISQYVSTTDRLATGSTDPAGADVLP